MPGLARQGDFFGLGGFITFPVSPNVFVNGLPAALDTIAFTPHVGCSPKTPWHCFGIVFGTDLGVKINGKTPVLLGSRGTCLHTVSSASKNVIVR